MGGSPNLHKAFENLFEQFKLGAPERAQIKAAGTSNELVEILSKLESPTDKQKALLEKLKSFGRRGGMAASRVNPRPAAPLPGVSKSRPLFEPIGFMNRTPSA